MQTSWKAWANRKAVLSLVAAGILTVLGVLSAWDTYWLDERGVVTTATVLDERPSGRRSTTIDVRFVTAKGQTVEAHTEHYYSAEVGGEISILYDPEKPERMQAADWDLHYLVAMMWLGGALVSAVFGLLRFLGLTARLRQMLTQS